MRGQGSEGQPNRKRTCNSPFGVRLRFGRLPSNHWAGGLPSTQEGVRGHHKPENGRMRSISPNNNFCRVHWTLKTTPAVAGGRQLFALVFQTCEYDII
jgi:hypothetical protein